MNAFEKIASFPQQFKKDMGEREDVHLMVIGCILFLAVCVAVISVAHFHLHWMTKVVIVNIFAGLAGLVCLYGPMFFYQPNTTKKVVIWGSTILGVIYLIIAIGTLVFEYIKEESW